MRIVLRNLARQRIGRVEVIESQRPTRVHIEPAAREVMLDWEGAVDDAGHLRKCLACGGGHAAVVAEAAKAAGHEVLGYCADDEANPSPGGAARLGAIADARGLASKHNAHVHAAVGDATLRRNWLALVRNIDAATIVHPSAIISPSARINSGVFVSAGVVINARAVIEQGAIINTSAVIEHDCLVGEFSHVAPRAVLAGNVTVGSDVLIGVGAVVLPRKRIGDGATGGLDFFLVRAPPIDDGAGQVKIIPEKHR